MRREAGIDVLLVEDSECDAELAMRTLRKQQLADRVVHVQVVAVAFPSVADRQVA